MFNFFTKKKNKEQAQTIVIRKANNIIYVAGQNMIKANTNNSEVEQFFSNLLKFKVSSNTLLNNNTLNSINYITNYHHYGKKASNIYKSFCANELIIDGVADTEKEEILNYLGSLFSKNSVNGLYELQSLIVKSVLSQGGLSYFITISPSEMGLVYNLITIPLNSVTPVVKDGIIKYQSDKINLDYINKALSEEEKYEYISDHPQFFLFFYDKDIQTNKPIPFFSSAPDVLYTESLFQKLMREIVNRFALLKYAHYKYKNNEVGAMPLYPDDTENKEKEAILNQIKTEIVNPTGAIIDDGQGSQKHVAFLQGQAITDENMEINTFSTLEVEGIEPVRKTIERPIASALMVPAQLLGLSDSKTETQYGIDTELFLEMESEIRDFCSGVLHSLVSFKYALEERKLPLGFKIKISESSVVRAVQNSQAEKTKAETKNIELTNLKLKKELGYEVTPEEIEALGYVGNLSAKADIELPSTDERGIQ